MKSIPLAGICMIVALWSAPAWAQDPAAAQQPAEPSAIPPPAPYAATTPPPAETPPPDGPRFRGAISLAAGLESVSDDFGNSVSGFMFGVDGRMGLQLNDLLGFYVQPHLSFGSLSNESSSLSGFTGTFTVAAMAEVTLIDRIFIGAGFGYGVLNNPAGPMFQARVGGYPLMGRGESGVHRKGLMIGVDLRTVFVSGGTGILVLGAIGYEVY